MTDPTPRPAGSSLPVSLNTPGDMYCAACDGKPGYMHSCSRSVGVGVDVQVDPICATCGGPIIDLWYPKDDVDLDDLLVPEFSTHGAAGESRVPPRGPNADGSWPSHGMVIDDKPGGGPPHDVPKEFGERDDVMWDGQHWVPKPAADRSVSPQANDSRVRPCEVCGGEGRVVLGYVTRDMAADACEPSMEGMEVPGPCEACGGTGLQSRTGLPTGAECAVGHDHSSQMEADACDAMASQGLLDGDVSADAPSFPAKLRADWEYNPVIANEVEQACYAQGWRDGLANASADTHSVGLTFDALRVVNVSRAEKWHDGAEPWSLADWSNAVAGEVGEACNVVKKVRRLETKTARTREDERDRDRLIEALADELADTAIYLDLLAHQAGVDLGAAIAAKFNRTSETFGFDERLPVCSAPSRSEDQP